MKEYRKKIISLATKEILLSIFDTFTPFFEASTIYRKSTREYLRRRNFEKSIFWRKIYYWKERGLIETFVEGKDKYIELTKKGKNCLKNTILNEIKIKIPDQWDGKWRMVIFDIPESKRDSRDIIRQKLKQLGFVQLQKSVYIFPYECTLEIQSFVHRLNLKGEVLIAIAEIIQGERKIIKHFIDADLIHKKDLKKKLQ